MIRRKYLAGRMFALAFNSAGEELSVDPDVPPTIALVRGTDLSPSNDRLLVGAKIFR